MWGSVGRLAVRRCEVGQCAAPSRLFFHLALEALDLVDVLLPALALCEAILHLGELRHPGDEGGEGEEGGENGRGVVVVEEEEGRGGARHLRRQRADLRLCELLRLLKLLSERLRLRELLG